MATYRLPIIDGYVYFKPQGLVAALPISFLPSGTNQGTHAELSGKQVSDLVTGMLSITFPFFQEAQNIKFNVLPREEGEERGKYIVVSYRHPVLAAQVTIRIQLPEEIAMRVLRTVELGTEVVDTLLYNAIENLKNKLVKF